MRGSFTRNMRNTYPPATVDRPFNIFEVNPVSKRIICRSNWPLQRILPAAAFFNLYFIVYANSTCTPYIQPPVFSLWSSAVVAC